MSFRIFKCCGHEKNIGIILWERYCDDLSSQLGSYSKAIVIIKQTTFFVFAKYILEDQVPGKEGSVAKTLMGTSTLTPQKINLNYFSYLQVKILKMG